MATTERDKNKTFMATGTFPHRKRFHVITAELTSRMEEAAKLSSSWCNDRRSHKAQAIESYRPKKRINFLYFLHRTAAAERGNDGTEQRKKAADRTTPMWLPVFRSSAARQGKIVFYAKSCSRFGITRVRCHKHRMNAFQFLSRSAYDWKKKIWPGTACYEDKKCNKMIFINHV